MQRQLFLPLTFLLLFVNAGFAQFVEVKAQIKDAVSYKPISHATVTTDNAAYGTMSNSDGYFRLYCPSDTNIIIIKHVGYKTLRLTQKINEVVLLEPEQLMLDEAIIINIPVDVLLRELIENSINKLNTPIQLSTYYREFVKYNGNYSKFADGLLDYQIWRKKQKIDTELVVTQSRGNELKKQEEELLIVGMGPDVRKAVDYACSFEVLNKTVLYKKEHTKYEFSIIAKNNEDGTSKEIILFSPKQGIEEALYEGQIIYNPDTKIILDYNIRLVPSLRKFAKEYNWLFARFSVDDLVYKCSFTEAGGNYMLSYCSGVGNVTVWNKKRTNTYSYNSDLIVTNFTTDNTKFTAPEKYKYRSLYERGSRYTEKYWLSNNSIVLTDEEEQIIQKLRDQKNTENLKK